jgi:hypothetical protein
MLQYLESADEVTCAQIEVQLAIRDKQIRLIHKRNACRLLLLRESKTLFLKFTALRKAAQAHIAVAKELRSASL